MGWWVTWLSYIGSRNMFILLQLLLALVLAVDPLKISFLHFYLDCPICSHNILFNHHLLAHNQRWLLRKFHLRQQILSMNMVILFWGNQIRSLFEDWLRACFNIPFDPVTLFLYSLLLLHLLIDDILHSYFLAAIHFAHKFRWFHRVILLSCCWRLEKLLFR